MFGRPDHTYNDIREKSLMQWLDEMEQHPDIAVHGGVKLAREYVDHLKTEIARLESENALKAEYLKKDKRKEIGSAPGIRSASYFFRTLTVSKHVT